MSDPHYVVLSGKPWNATLADLMQERVGGTWTTIRTPEELTLERLAALKPRYIFVPHWSHRIDQAIIDTFECVIFHETDLPYGRGGSPVQNLIVRGVKETKMTALRATDEIDAGDVYLKRPLSLEGTARDIFFRANDVIAGMIETIVKESPEPTPQTGEPVVFKRRKPAEGNLHDLGTLEEIYDYIRMLDADGYPPAFFNTSAIKFEFTGARFDESGDLIAEVRIRAEDD